MNVMESPTPSLLPSFSRFYFLHCGASVWGVAAFHTAQPFKPDHDWSPEEEQSQVEPAEIRTGVCGRPQLLPWRWAWRRRRRRGRRGDRRRKHPVILLCVVRCLIFNRVEEFFLNSPLANLVPPPCGHGLWGPEPLDKGSGLCEWEMDSSAGVVDWSSRRTDDGWS